MNLIIEWEIWLQSQFFYSKHNPLKLSTCLLEKEKQSSCINWIPLLHHLKSLTNDKVFCCVIYRWVSWSSVGQAHSFKDHWISILHRYTLSQYEHIMFKNTSVTYTLYIICIIQHVACYRMYLMCKIWTLFFTQ